MSIDAMKQVLAVMDTVAPSVEASAPRYYAAREALRAAIEQAQRNEFNPDWDAMAVMVEEQQRMAKRIDELEAQQKPWVKTYAGGKPNYTVPEEQAQPRQWQGLTDKEIVAIELNPRQYYDGKSLRFDLSLADFARAIEAKLKEKNT